MPIFDVTELDTLTLGEGHPRLVLVPDHHDIRNSSCKHVIVLILQVHNIECTRVLLSVGDDAHTTNVVSAGNHGDVARLEFQKVRNLAGGKIHLDAVIDLDLRVGISQCASIVGDHDGDVLGILGDLFHPAELVSGLVLVDLVDRKSPLRVKEETKVLPRLVNSDHVHEPGGESHVRADLVVYLDQSLHSDHLCLMVGQGIFQSVAE